MTSDLKKKEAWGSSITISLLLVRERALFKPIFLSFFFFLALFVGQRNPNEHSLKIAKGMEREEC